MAAPLVVAASQVSGHVSRAADHCNWATEVDSVRCIWPLHVLGPLRTGIVCALVDVGDARCCMCLLHCRFHINIDNGDAKLEALKALKYNPGF